MDEQLLALFIYCMIVYHSHTYGDDLTTRIYVMSTVITVLECSISSYPGGSGM